MLADCELRVGSSTRPAWLNCLLCLCIRPSSAPVGRSVGRSARAGPLSSEVTAQLEDGIIPEISLMALIVKENKKDGESERDTDSEKREREKGNIYKEVDKERTNFYN